MTAPTVWERLRATALSRWHYVPQAEPPRRDTPVPQGLYLSLLDLAEAAEQAVILESSPKYTPAENSVIARRAEKFRDALAAFHLLAEEASS